MYAWAIEQEQDSRKWLSSFFFAVLMAQSDPARRRRSRRSFSRRRFWPSSPCCVFHCYMQPEAPSLHHRYS